MQPDRTTPLPALDERSQAHTDACAAFIRDRIQDAGGRISFAAFMQHALYAPGLGYYAAGATKFGEAGDFVTAPEVSRLFGTVLARQVAEVLAAIPDGSVAEVGGGSGRLAIDVLKALEALDALPASYAILEVSADLRERQEASIEREVPQLRDRVCWLDALPDAHRGVILANEVLDALPVERFVRRETVMQLCVALEGERFRLVERQAPPNLADAVAAIERELGTRLADGYCSEVSLALPAWIAELVAGLDEAVALLFDYGTTRRAFYAPDRSTGWLRCHTRHHAHDDALIRAGVQDITAWVDFSQVAAAAHEAGGYIAGYLSQAQFLLNGGIGELLASSSTGTPTEQLELSRQVKMLTLPGQMGERFKCLGISRGTDVVPAALKVADRTHTL